MRDWLKNVLITLYERDEDNNLLTEKQKLKVRDRGGSLGAHPCNGASTDRKPVHNDLWDPCKVPPKVPPCTPFPLLTRSPWPLPWQVKKIHENEKRLEAGDHTVELLARDFEKNYNMYIFPVHWQFGQLDQHPFDG